MKKWVYILYDHESFKNAKPAIVSVNGNYEFIHHYRNKAVEIICKHIYINCSRC